MSRTQMDGTGAEIGRRLALQATTGAKASRPTLRVRLHALPVPERSRAG